MHLDGNDSASYGFRGSVELREGKEIYSYNNIIKKKYVNCYGIIMLFGAMLLVVMSSIYNITLLWHVGLAGNGLDAITTREIPIGVKKIRCRV